MHTSSSVHINQCIHVHSKPGLQANSHRKICIVYVIVFSYYFISRPNFFISYDDFMLTKADDYTNLKPEAETPLSTSSSRCASIMPLLNTARKYSDTAANRAL